LSPTQISSSIFPSQSLSIPSPCIGYVVSHGCNKGSIVLYLALEATAEWLTHNKLKQVYSATSQNIAAGMQDELEKWACVKLVL